MPEMRTCTARRTGAPGRGRSFIVAGADNVAPRSAARPRWPLAKLRLAEGAQGLAVAQKVAGATEYWLQIPTCTHRRKLA
jgi:hypothetical protein